MDYLLLGVGIVMILQREYSWLFAIIVLLASTYLQLPLKPEMQLMIGPAHNVSDVGLLLYLLFFSKEVITKGFYTKGVLQRSVFLFYLFLLLNGLYDIINGVVVGDILSYLKHWTYLSIVFILPNITRAEVLDSIRIIFWITLACCVVLILQYLLGFVWIGYSTLYVSDGVVYTRGAKPPSYVIICFMIALSNILQLKWKAKIMACLLFALPILLTLKMSYFATLIGIAAIFYLIKNSYSLLKILNYTFISLVSLFVLLTVFPVFNQRLHETIAQSQTLTSGKGEKGNFSYRIEHFAERLDYVLSDPIRSIRGLGYVQERNFHEKIFKLGQLNQYGRKAQLDTGDIAWSILIIRLGIIGIILYLLFYRKCLLVLYNQGKKNDVDLLFFSYLFASLFVMSWGNTIIANSEFFIFPLLICMTHEDSTLHI